MVIRPPGYTDVAALLELGAQLHQESAYAFLPYDRDKVRGLIIAYIEDRDTRCGLVAEHAGAIIGMIGGCLIDYYFCNETLVSDEVFFLTPARRGGLTAMRLIRGLRQWAKDRGARELCLAVSTGIRVEATGMFYERLGFTRVGGVYKQRLSAG